MSINIVSGAQTDETVGPNGEQAPTLQAAVANLQPKVPSRVGFNAAKAGDVFQCGGGVSIGFDGTGAISHLVGSDGYTYAGTNHTLASEPH